MFVADVLLFGTSNMAPPVAFEEAAFAGSCKRTDSKADKHREQNKKADEDLDCNILWLLWVNKKFGWRPLVYARVADAIVTFIRENLKKKFFL